MHTPHSLTHPHSLYPTNYTSLTFIQTHSQSSFKAHSSHIHTLTLSPHSAHSSHILTHAHTLNLPLMHTPLTLTHLHSLCPTNYTSLTFIQTHSQSSFIAHSSHIHTLTLSPHSVHSSHILTFSHTHTLSISL